MTDKERIHQILSSLWKNDDSVGKRCYNQALQDVQTAIDLQEETVSKDFEEALAMEWQGYNDRGAATVDALEDNTQELAFSKGFYRGSNWQKEQMLAKAIDIEVKVDAGGYPYIPQMELYDYEKDIPLAKEGDKYKVILIKED